MLGILTQEEIVEMLTRNLIGRIGCNDGEKTYVVPISYVYDNNALLCHSKDGMKIEMMRRSPEVCFQMDEIKDYNNWRSVIAWGTYEELTEEQDIEHARQFFSDIMLDMKTTRSSLPPHTQQERFHHDKPGYVPSIFYKMHLHKITGRFEQST